MAEMNNLRIKSFCIIAIFLIFFSFAYNAILVADNSEIIYSPLRTTITLYNGKVINLPAPKGLNLGRVDGLDDRLDPIFVCPYESELPMKALFSSDAKNWVKKARKNLSIIDLYFINPAASGRVHYPPDDDIFFVDAGMAWQAHPGKTAMERLAGFKYNWTHPLPRAPRGYSYGDVENAILYAFPSLDGKKVVIKGFMNLNDVNVNFYYLKVGASMDDFEFQKQKILEWALEMRKSYSAPLAVASPS